MAHEAVELCRLAMDESGGATEVRKGGLRSPMRHADLDSAKPSSPSFRGAPRFPTDLDGSRSPLGPCNEQRDVAISAASALPLPALSRSTRKTVTERDLSIGKLPHSAVYVHKALPCYLPCFLSSASAIRIISSSSLVSTTHARTLLPAFVISLLPSPF